MTDRIYLKSFNVSRSRTIKCWSYKTDIIDKLATLTKVVLLLNQGSTGGGNSPWVLPHNIDVIILYSWERYSGLQVMVPDYQITTVNYSMATSVPMVTLVTMTIIIALLNYLGTIVITIVL